MSYPIDRQAVARQIKTEKAITAATLLGVLALVGAGAWAALQGALN
jgi:hypothetical protein